jgi:catechol 2,3-dioxygenase-like lactoylglutathione lyase family enzyme
MSIRRVHHIQVNVPTDALDAARDFYCGFMGFREIPRPETFVRAGVWFLVGETEVHIGLEDGVDRTLTRAHIAYEVPDLAEWRAKIAARGWAVREQPEIPGYLRIQFRDPFGNNLELIQRA